VAALLYFADDLAHSIRVDHIMRVVERTTLPVIRDLPQRVCCWPSPSARSAQPRDLSEPHRTGVVARAVPGLGAPHDPAAHRRRLAKVLLMLTHLVAAAIVVPAVARRLT
jgi:hypothetical protein